MPQPGIHKQIPAATIETLARSVHDQASAYGFTRLDHIRLVNALLSLGGEESTTDVSDPETRSSSDSGQPIATAKFDSLPLETNRLVIERFDGDAHREALEYWLRDSFNRFFLLTSSGRYLQQPEWLVGQPEQHLALVRTNSGHPVGALAYLDHDSYHCRAEFRILIGDSDARKQGLGFEAAAAWLGYGLNALSLDKIYVQLLEGDIRSARLFERLGFGLEALLPGEIRLDGTRRNIERWALQRS